MIALLDSVILKCCILSAFELSKDLMQRQVNQNKNKPNKAPINERGAPSKDHMWKNTAVLSSMLLSWLCRPTLCNCYD
jgi:hypothetical protein